MGRRRRRATGTARAPGPAAPTPPSRSEQKEAAARASLEPLAPGERPGAVTVAMVVCAAGVVVLVGGAASGLLDTGSGRLSGLVASVLILAVAGIGMYRGRYWAVLGFEAVLLLNIIVMFGLLLRASSWLGLLVALAVIVPSSVLFYKLIRAMARIQMPNRPGLR